MSRRARIGSKSLPLRELCPRPWTRMTTAAGVARELGFRYLDSGSLYRLVALKALRAGIPLTDEPALAAAASDLDFAFGNGGVQLDREDATEGIRSEAVSAAASQVAVHPAVRRALL